MKTRASFYNDKFAKGLLIIFLIFCCHKIEASGTPPRNMNLHDSIVIKTSRCAKIHKVKLYADLLNKALIFSAKGEQGKAYQLFLFDMDGKLVKQTQVLNSETALLTTFEKGNYIYEVFSNDDRIENGSIAIQ